MSWPEQRVSPPIYNIKARYVAARRSFPDSGKLHRQTFHRGTCEARRAAEPSRAPVDTRSHRTRALSLVSTACRPESPRFPPAKTFRIVPQRRRDRVGCIIYARLRLICASRAMRLERCSPRNVPQNKTRFGNILRLLRNIS